MINYGLLNVLNVGLCGGDTRFTYAGSSGLISCAPCTICTIDHAVLLVGITQLIGLLKILGGQVGVITGTATSPRIPLMTVTSGST